MLSSDQQKVMFKQKLKAFCQQVIEQRVHGAQASMHASQESSNAEEKSSAGDKYETARAMGHLERDMHARQLAEYVKELAALHVINVDHIYDKGSPGSYVECKTSNFFIACGLGRQQVGDAVIIFLSVHAPLAKLLLHKKAGDSFIFNGKQEEIQSVY